MDADYIVRALGLSPHPEGGYFKETFRANAENGARAAQTAIYFLLPAGTFSAFHRFPCDEVWHHYQGDPVELFTIDEAGNLHGSLLGKDIARGERPQAVVRASTWQAARPVGTRFALVGCTVAPAFDFAELELPSRDLLCAQFPQHRDLITGLTRA